MKIEINNVIIDVLNYETGTFVTKERVNKQIFDNVSSLSFTNEKNEISILENIKNINIIKLDDVTLIVPEFQTESEVAYDEINSNLEYLAMMIEVDL